MSQSDLEHQQNCQVAGFIAKTYQILLNNEFSKIIFWSCSGSEFVIKDINKFQQAVLPRYFRHNKMNSFIRQLNMYGFHKARKENARCVFSHPDFLQGRSDLLINIKRKIKGKNDIQSRAYQTPKKKSNNWVEETAVKEDNHSDNHTKQTPLTNLKGFQSGEISEKPFSLNEFKSSFCSKININFSLGKVSHTQIAQLFICETVPKDDDYVSIEDNIQKLEQQYTQTGKLSKFINPSLFFDN